ncbi:MAG: hypothetical protein M9894_06400 [Planctomycetes bacterium]|nr:hypothetical protein [Planctomycetota bacterium]
MRRKQRILLGGAIWLTGLAVAVAAARAHGPEVARPADRIGRWLLSSPRTVEGQLQGPLALGDPLLDARRQVIGRVVRVRGPDGADLAATWYAPLAVITSGTPFTVTVALDPEATAPAGARLASYAVARNDGQWMLRTLLPEHKWRVVVDETRAFLAENEREVQAFLRPLAEDAIGHGMLVLEQNLSAALETRRDAIQKVLDEHRVMVKNDLLPVLKRRLGPSAKVKAQPILREIGRELWDELPMWSLGWSAFVDRIPGTSRTRMDQWWNEFVENKAIPILKAHEDELIKALEDLVEEGARDPEVRAALGAATRRLADDPRFKAIVRGVIEDALVKPFDVRALLDRLMADPAHQARFRRLQELFNPGLQRIGRRMTIDPETGRLDPDLARVLRRVVFNKDARWVELVDPDAPTASAPRGP